MDVQKVKEIRDRIERSKIQLPAGIPMPTPQFPSTYQDSVELLDEVERVIARDARMLALLKTMKVHTNKTSPAVYNWIHAENDVDELIRELEA